METGTRGVPPQDVAALRQVSVDPGDIQAFWQTHYLDRFIRRGGSKVKWVVGREGAGKTHALRYLEMVAQSAGYLTVALDARVTSLRGIQELTREALAILDRTVILNGLTEQAIQKMGYEVEEQDPSAPFLEWLVNDRGVQRAVAVRYVREACGEVLQPLDLDLNLKAAVGHALEQRLGVVRAETDALDRWFLGEKVLKRELAPLGISQSLTRFNARSILEGWALLALTTGLPGIVLTIDGLEQVLAAREDGRPYYTRSRRDELYELIRELIDEGDVLSGLFVVLATRPELFSDAKRGVKSYPALDARVANEVQARDLNRFDDLVDWERPFRLAPNLLEELARRWGDLIGLSSELLPSVGDIGTVSIVRRTVEAVMEAHRQEGSGSHGYVG